LPYMRLALWIIANACRYERTREFAGGKTRPE
jgi:hypothetical protein